MRDAGVGGEVACKRDRHRAAVSETSPELVVPLGQSLRARDELVTRARSVLFIGMISLPEVEHGIAGETKRGRSGDETGHLGERRRLGATFGEVAPEGVVQAP